MYRSGCSLREALSGRVPPTDIKAAFGFVPAGFAAMSGHWHALLQDYGVPNSPFAGTAPSLLHMSIGYYVAAVVGIAIIAGITFWSPG